MDNSQISKEFFIQDILSSINSENIEDIKTQLYQTMSKYSINIENNIKDDAFQYNNLILKNFLMAKQIEGKSKNTLSLYKLYIEDFIKNIDKSIENISSFDIRCYLMNTQQQRKISNRTLDSRRSSIHSFLSWCCGEKIINNNPLTNVKPIKYEVIQKMPLTNRELLLLRESCNNIRDKAIIEVLYSTGVRVSELISIKKQDINFDTNEIVVEGKGNKIRKVYLNDATNYYLKQYLDSRTDKSDYLFVSIRSPHNNLTKSGIEKIVSKVGVKAKLNRKITPHLFRHTCATNLLQRGMDVTEIQKILGHSNISTTMIYSKTLDADIKNHHQKYIV